MISDSIERAIALESSHVAAAIANATMREYPSSHIHVESLFSDAFYARLLAMFPRNPQAFVRWAHGGDPTAFFGNYDRRREINFPNDLVRLNENQREFWSAMDAYLCGYEFARILVDKFHACLMARFGNDLNDTHFIEKRMRGAAMLNAHDPDYYLGPHTDRYEKIITCVFYMPERTELDHLGTALYDPLEAGFTCRGTVHHDPAKFVLREIVPFRPNSAFIFARSDVLFHGVERIAPDSALGSERPGFQMQFWERAGS